MMIMFEPLRKYAAFSGRADRKEYWLFFLFCILMLSAALIIDVFILIAFELEILSALNVIVILVFFIPSLAVGVRRLHDTDRSGWWMLLYLLLCFVGLLALLSDSSEWSVLLWLILWLIFFVGSLVLFIFFCSDGTKGGNRFGADPKA